VAFGCAGFVLAHPGTIVVTVTAGRPGPHPLTDWDRKCGFRDGDDVVGTRRQEDDAALRGLGATPVWLDFLDHQYAPEASVAEVAEAIEGAVGDFETVASPLGLGHGDHLVTAAACLEVSRRHPAKRWFLYEDAIYRQTMGGSDEALSRLREGGFELEEAWFPVEGGVKRASVAAYSSQAIGLGRLLDDAYAPERYWKMMARV
jgi:LmbE family N-acetylglucosaminyl deacetylase